MNDRARQKLVQLLDEETLGVLDEPERLEGLLRDYCGDCRKEISALIAALQEDVPADLTRGSSEPYPILTARLAGKLHDERNIVPDAAQWAVESWAYALEVAPGSKRSRGVAGAPAGFQGVQQGFAGAGAASGPGSLGASGPAAGEWKMPPPVDVNLQKTPLPDLQGGWQQTPPGPPPPGQPPGPGKTPIQPWQAQAEPWKTPVGGPQLWAPGNAAALPAHNSLLACVCCLGVTILIAYLIPVYGTMGGLLQIVLVIFAMATGIELLLAMVRMMLKRPQPPAFVISSMSFWMTLFGAENAVLKLFPGKQKQRPQMGAPAAYPIPGAPPAVQSYAPPGGPAPVQSTVTPPFPLPNQTPVSQQAPAGLPAPGDGVFCVMCGKTNAKGASTCANCGEKLYYPEAQPGAAPN